MRTAYPLLYVMRSPSQIAPVKSMTEITPVPENLTREAFAPQKTILPGDWSTGSRAGHAAAATNQKTESPLITRIKYGRDGAAYPKRICGSVLILSCLFAFFVDILFPSVAFTLAEIDKM
jgi:hypothetical protein